MRMIGISTRFTEEEMKKIEQGAKNRGIDRSKYIREKVLGDYGGGNHIIYNTEVRQGMEILTDVYLKIDSMTQEEIKDTVKRGVELIWQYLK